MLRARVDRRLAEKLGDGRTVCYAVPQELTSPLWARAFARGCQGVVTVADTLSDGPVAMFGSPARRRVLEEAQAAGRTWYYGDHAYFGRRVWFRITRNAYQHDGRGKGDPLRFEQHGVRIRSWRKDGRDILLCPNSPGFFKLFGLDVDEWIHDTTRELRRYTDRQVRVRFKTDPGDFDVALRNVWAVVVHVSVCGVHAALAGVPCFATSPCASLAFGTDDLSRIEHPVRPDNRFELASVLASNQWTLHEIAQGKAWRVIR